MDSSHALALVISPTSDPMICVSSIFVPFPPLNCPSSLDKAPGGFLLTPPLPTPFDVSFWLLPAHYTLYAEACLAYTSVQLRRCDYLEPISSTIRYELDLYFILTTLLLFFQALTRPSRLMRRRTRRRRKRTSAISSSRRSSFWPSRMRVRRPTLSPCTISWPPAFTSPPSILRPLPLQSRNRAAISNLMFLPPRLGVWTASRRRRKWRRSPELKTCGSSSSSRNQPL